MKSEAVPDITNEILLDRVQRLVETAHGLAVEDGAFIFGAAFGILTARFPPVLLNSALAAFAAGAKSGREIGRETDGGPVPVTLNRFVAGESERAATLGETLEVPDNVLAAMTTKGQKS